MEFSTGRHSIWVAESIVESESGVGPQGRGRGKDALVFPKG
jgi:hypothetical protein